LVDGGDDTHDGLALGDGESPEVGMADGIVEGGEFIGTMLAAAGFSMGVPIGGAKSGGRVARFDGPRDGSSELEVGLTVGGSSLPSVGSLI